MNNHIEDGDFTAEILQDARFNYRRLTTALREAIRRVEGNDFSKEAVKEREEALRELTKNLNTLMALEVDLAKRSNSIARPTSGNTLDLEDARREIGERLSKLATIQRD